MYTTSLKPSEDLKVLNLQFTVMTSCAVIVAYIWLYMFATTIHSQTFNVIYYAKFRVRMYRDVFSKGVVRCCLTTTQNQHLSGWHTSVCLVEHSSLNSWAVSTG